MGETELSWTDVNPALNSMPLALEIATFEGSSETEDGGKHSYCDTDAKIPKPCWSLVQHAKGLPRVRLTNHSCLPSGTRTTTVRSLSVTSRIIWSSETTRLRHP